MRKAFALALIFAVALVGAPASAVTASKGAANDTQADAAKVVGVIKDSAGKPMANATVSINGVSVTTDANGLFSLNVPAGAAGTGAKVSATLSVTPAGSTVATTSTITIVTGSTTTIAATVSAAGVLAVTTGAAGFIAALGGPIAAAALVAGGIVGAVAIQQALDETQASPSR